MSLTIMEMSGDAADKLDQIVKAYKACENGTPSTCSVFCNEPGELIVDVTYVLIGERDWNEEPKEHKLDSATHMEWEIAQAMDLLMPEWRSASFLCSGL